MKSTLRFQALNLPDASTALPSEFRILSFGINPFWRIGQDEEGELLFDAASAKAVMAGFKSKGLDSIAIDLDHQIVNGGNSDTAGKAYGWWVPQVRADGLYATKVKWTPEGAALLSGKSYRFFSPTVQTDDEGRVLDLLPLALTNMPALKNISALVAANATAKPNMTITILSALGLAADADEAKTLATVEALKTEHGQLLALSGKATLAEAVGAFTALKAQADRVEALSAEVSTLRAEKLSAEVNALLDEAQRDGRVAPAKREEMLKLSADHGPAALRACLSMLPRQPGQTAPHVEPKEEPKTLSATSGMTADQLKILSKLGTTPEQFSKFSRAYTARITGAESVGE